MLFAPGDPMGKRPEYMDVTRRSGAVTSQHRPMTPVEVQTTPSVEKQTLPTSDPKAKPSRKRKTIDPCTEEEPEDSPPPPAREINPGPDSPPNVEAEASPTAPISAAEFPVGHFWGSKANIYPDVRKGLQAPDHWFDGKKLSKTEMKELEHAGLKHAGLCQLVAYYKEETARLGAKVGLLKTKKKESDEQLLKAREELDIAKATKESLDVEIVSVRNELNKVESEANHRQQIHKDDLAIIKKYKADITELKSELNETAALKSELGELKSELSSNKVALQSALDDVAKLKSGVVDAFANALEQVQFRNPTVTLNLEGVHVNAYVDDGVFIPALSPHVGTSNENPEDLPEHTSGDLPC